MKDAFKRFLFLVRFGGLLLLLNTKLAQALAAISVHQLHQQYAKLPEGKHINQRVSVDVLVEQVKPTSPRLVFLRARDAGSSEEDVVELLLRERDGFLSTNEIDQLATAAARPGAIIHCIGFPERLSDFDGPSFFPHLKPLPATPLCLHVVAANVTLPNGEVLDHICPTEKPQPKINKGFPSGRMPPLVNRKSSSGNRGGGGNRDRGGIFAAWAMDKFHLSTATTSILDVAGGSGQLAFQLGVRRGFNVTVVDPRELRLASDQQRTLQYHRTTGLRLLPGERDASLPPSAYGHHFYELPCTDQSTRERTFLVSEQAQVRHLQLYFDTEFASTNKAWNDCSVVLGMHPDEPTEDIVDLALQNDKPFAVVPCCVFWKQNPHRTYKGKQVRSWEQFCDYLAAKDPQRIQTDILPFPGRNTVLYSLEGSSG